MDNLLIYLVQSYNREALNILVEKYQKFIPAWVKEILSNLSISKEVDIDVIIDDVKYSIYKMIETYNQDKGIFYSYIKGAANNIVMNHLRGCKKHSGYILSLEYEIDEGYTLLDSLSSNDNMSKIIERYNMIEEVENFNEKINILKEDEKNIIKMKMQGYSKDEISNMTNTSIRKVNYLINKVKKL